MICNVNNIAFYAVPHDSSNVLGKKSSSTKVIERVRFVGQEVKGNVRRYFEAVREGVEPVLYAWVVVEGIVVKIAKLRGVPL